MTGRISIAIAFIVIGGSAFLTDLIQPEAAAPENSIKLASMNSNAAATLSAGVPKKLDEALLSFGTPVVVNEFYNARQNAPIWIENGAITAAALAFEAVLENASHEGMAGRFDVDQLKRSREFIQTNTNRPSVWLNRVAEYEVNMTKALLDYSLIQNNGLLKEALLDSTAQVDFTALLNKVATSSTLPNLNPHHEQYGLLQIALTKYENLSWSPIESGATLKKGQNNDRIIQLRNRLTAEGDLDKSLAGADSSFMLYDDAVEAAVTSFQLRYGLDVDGKVGNGTLAALNVPAEERAHRIVLNMERIRQLPVKDASAYILINVPEFSLRVMDQDTVTAKMNVVVGKAGPHQTPIFSDTLQYLVFAPYWNVPRSIVMNEFLPRLRLDSTYLQSRRFEILNGWENGAKVIEPDSSFWSNVNNGRFPYRLRRKPGAGNDLGRVKFMMPNVNSIYLHDTQARHLFSQTRRDYSHGCIRVGEPARLADLIMQGQRGWNDTKIETAMDGDSERAIALNYKWPVHIVYWTTWVDANGNVNFRDDIYDLDQQLSESLFPGQAGTVNYPTGFMAAN